MVVAKFMETHVTSLNFQQIDIPKKTSYHNRLHLNLLCIKVIISLCIALNFKKLKY